MNDSDATPGARLLRAVAKAAVPSAVREAWTSTPPTPEAGQVWRARWDETAQALLILEVEQSRIRAAPVSFDTEMADDSAVVLNASYTWLGVGAVVWIDLAQELPVRVLDRWGGRVAVPLDVLAKLPRGSAVLNAMDDRALVKAELMDAMETFASARWAPEGDGSLGERLVSLGIQRIIELLGCRTDEALALMRGQQPLTEEQAEVMGPELGASPDELLLANPPLPPKLVDDLDPPHWRAKVIQLARLRDVGEPEAWRTAGYGTYALAARQTDRGEPAWEERIAQYFAGVLGE